MVTTISKFAQQNIKIQKQIQCGKILNLSLCCTSGHFSARRIIEIDRRIVGISRRSFDQAQFLDSVIDSSNSWLFMCTRNRFLLEDVLYWGVARRFQSFTGTCSPNISHFPKGISQRKDRFSQWCTFLTKVQLHFMYNFA